MYKRDLRFMARIIVQECNCVIFLKKYAGMRSINSRAFIKHYKNYFHMHAKAFPALLFVVHHFLRCRAAENVSSPENVTTTTAPPPQTKTDSLNLLTYNVWLIPFLSKDLVSMNCFRLKRSLYFFHIDLKGQKRLLCRKKGFRSSPRWSRTP